MKLAAPTPAMAEALDRRLLLSAVPQMVKDLQTGTAGSGPHHFTDVNGTVFFAATDGGGVYRDDLYKSDGTPGGTVRVKDFGPDDGPQIQLLNFAAVNGRLYFAAPDADASNYELWTSDGTDARTYRVKDTLPGPGSGGAGNLTNVNGTLFFTARDENGDQELYKSDGTDAGTVRVIDFPAGNDGLYPDALTAVGDTLYYQLVNEFGGAELWKSDGTEEGTVAVAPLGTATRVMFVLGDRLLFFLNTTAAGDELWTSDGTAEGTVLVKDINPGPTGSSSQRAAVVGGALYFLAHDEAGFEPWKSDGTEAGTVRVKDINPGPEGSDASYFAGYNGAVYFTARDEAGFELWKTDGSDAGTVRVKDANPGIANFSPAYMTAVNGVMVFSATDSPSDQNPYELWRSDGTAAGTQLLKDIYPGPLGSYPDWFTPAAGKVYFSATDAAGGQEPWVTDGTAAGTFRLLDVNRTGTGSDPGGFVDVDGTLYFTWSPTPNLLGTDELWKSNGSPGGTTRVGDVNVSGPGVNVDGVLYFTGHDDEHGWQLWKTDGKPHGTVRVTDLDLGRSVGSPHRLAAFQGGVLFQLFDGVANGLWKSDGTPEGTTLVNSVASPVLDITAVGDVAYFAGRDPGDPFNGGSLSRTDGTAAGTYSLGGPFPQDITALNGSIFYRTGPTTTGEELWKSDGTAAGTMMVKDVFPGQNQYGAGFSSAPTHLTPFGDKLLFFAQNAESYTRRLWITDGTAAGTTLIGPDENNWVGGAVVGDAFYLGTARSVGDTTLWRTDGTAAGTYRVKSMLTGEEPAWMTDVGGTLYFTATTDARGTELWTSDGTEEGTVVAADITPGPASSHPYNLKVVGRTLFFSAHTPAAGRELWHLRVNGVAGHHVFYNGSRADGDSTAADERDDLAIAANKRPLAPLSSATFENVTSYSRGINGVMVDIAGLPQGVTLSAADFSFRAFNRDHPLDGIAVPAPRSITVRRGAGAGGSDRVTLAWTEPAVVNGWLRVVVKAGARAGLTTPDVFSFGNLIGETGDAADAFAVQSADFARTRLHLGQGDAASLNRYDFNRDGAITGMDVMIVRGTYRLGASIPGGDAVPPPTTIDRSTARPDRRRTWDEAPADLLR